MPTTTGAAAVFDYQPGAAHDEAFEPGGKPRPLYADLIARLAGTDLGVLTRAVAAELAAEGVSFGIGAGSAFVVDPIPRIVAAAEWDVVERGLAQRTRALAAYIADVYGDRAIVAAGIVPERVPESADHFEPWMTGIPTPAAGYLAGLDLVRGDDGVLRVLEDNIRTPSGLSYALAARAALDKCLPVDAPLARRDPAAAAFELLAATLRAAAPEGVDDPYVVLLSDGPHNTAWYDHRTLAEGAGIRLVVPDDLAVRDGRLRVTTEDGKTRPVDVVYRRTDEDRLRDEAGRPTWVADALLAPLQAGHLSVVNPFGAGVADDKLAHAYVEQMISFYLGEKPILNSVPTYDLGDPDVLAELLPRLDELVVKPRGGYGGEGVVVAPHATAEDRAALRARVLDRPDAYVAQELVLLSTHPTVRDGTLQPRHVDLRPYVIGAGDAATTVPGGLTRVAFGAGALVVNSSQDGGGKDTWVLGA